MKEIKKTLRVRGSAEQGAEQPAAGVERQITGRSVFSVSTVPGGISIETLFLRADGQLLRMPGLFPNRSYALGQIEELVQLVNQHFDAIERGAVAQ